MSMADTLMLTQRPAPGDPARDRPRMDVADVYSLDEIDLSAYRGIVVSGGCDLRFLSRRSERVSEWVRNGGRILINGHPVVRWLPGMPALRKLEFHTTRDLWLTAIHEHPIWAGIDRRDLLFSTGVPGEHSFAELTEIGVAGFYSHAYLVDLPEDARVITGIGQNALPVDVAYPWGSGEVIMHTGNDLFGFTRAGMSSDALADTAVAYLEEDR